MEDKLCWLWLALCDGVGQKKINYLLEFFENIQNIYKARKHLEQFSFLTAADRENLDCLGEPERLKETAERWDRKGIRFLTREEAEFPFRLKALSDAPFWLFVRGKLPKPGVLKIAVVGSRNCSGYGKGSAAYFAGELAGQGVEIISGLASGIDACAHRSALEAGGSTFGVLGCGIDICYPKENYMLYNKMQDKGGVLSEYRPGISPKPGLFPLRNRIISGISDGVLVAEAGERSGALITAELALEQGRDIFAVPGQIDDPLSIGCNKLIQEGAKAVMTAEDILKEYDTYYITAKEVFEKRKLVLETPEKIVYASLRLEPKHINQIIEDSGIEIQAVMGALMELQKKQLVRQNGFHYYSRCGL